MIESALMTTNFWEKMTPMLMRGYRKINKHVEANPSWWCLETLHRFGDHFFSHYEMLESDKHKITYLKKKRAILLKSTRIVADTS